MRRRGCRRGEGGAGNRVTITAACLSGSGRPEGPIKASLVGISEAPVRRQNEANYTPITQDQEVNETVRLIQATRYHTGARA